MKRSLNKSPVFSFGGGAIVESVLVRCAAAFASGSKSAQKNEVELLP